MNSLPAFAHRQQNDLQVLGVGFGRRASGSVVVAMDTEKLEKG